MDFDALTQTVGTLVKVVSPNGRTHYARVIGWNQNPEQPCLHLKAEFSASWTPIRKGPVNYYHPAWVTKWNVDPTEITS